MDTADYHVISWQPLPGARWREFLPAQNLGQGRQCADLVGVSGATVGLRPTKSRVFLGEVVFYSTCSFYLFSLKDIYVLKIEHFFLLLRTCAVLFSLDCDFFAILEARFRFFLQYYVLLESTANKC